MTPAVDYFAADQDQNHEPEIAAPQLPDYGPNNRNLPDQLKRALISIAKECQATEKFMRRNEVLQDAKNRFYDMGIQHIYRDNAWNWTAATPGGQYSTGPNSKNYFSDYIDDYNVFGPYAQIQRAKLAEHDPSVDFQPDDPNEPSDIESAKAAEAMRHDFDRNNDIKLLQQQIVYFWQMGGRCIVWTRTEDSPPRFGDVSGNPARQTVATAYGSIEAKVPLFANTLRDFGYCILYDDPEIKDVKSKYPWVAPRLSAGSMCLEENSWERIARIGIIQNSSGYAAGWGWNVGDSLYHLISRGNIFLRPSRFEGHDDPLELADPMDINEETGQVLTVKEKLLQLYPDGVHMLCIGSEYVESSNCSIDDCLSESHAYVGKGQIRMPMMLPMVVLQDRFNQAMNLIAESQDYLVPSTWIGCGATEYAAITKQRAKPGAFRNLKDMPAGVKITDLVYKEQDYNIPTSAMSFLQYLDGALPQFMLFCPPAIWGSAMSENKTAAGMQLAAAQAMGILGSFWDMLVQTFSSIYYQNCIAIAHDDQYPDQITIPDLKGRRSVVDKSSLTKGKFRCFPDKESGFPESTNSQRQSMERLVALLAPTPLGAQIMGSPDNAAALVRLSGVPLIIPEAEARNKQLREIEILLAQEPIIGDPIILAMVRARASVPSIAQAIQQARNAMMANYQSALQRQQVEHAGATLAAQASGSGAPPAPAPLPPPDPSTIAKSSVPVWPSDYQEYEARKCQDYLTSDQCNTELTIGRPSADPAMQGQMVPNIAGVLNVFLHWAEHVAAIPAQPMPTQAGALPAVGSPAKMAPQPAGG